MEFIDFDLNEKNLPKVLLTMKKDLVYGVYVKPVKKLFEVIILTFKGNYEISLLTYEKAKEVYLYFKGLIAKSDNLDE